MNPGTTQLLVSKTFEQCKELLKKIKSLMNATSVDYESMIGDEDNLTRLSLEHYETTFDDKGDAKKEKIGESRIICVPATTGALGYTADRIFADEIGFWENGKHIYNQILDPRTYHTKGPIKAVSNPNGKQGIMWDLWNRKTFYKLQFSYLDCPANTEKDYERRCEGKTKEEISSTLDATFTSPQGGFISRKERQAMTNRDFPNALPTVPEEPLYVFFDFAKSKDRTVRTIGSKYDDGDIEGVNVHEMKEYPRGTPYNEIIQELKDDIQSIGAENFATVGWDNSGVGAGIQDFIKRVQEFGVHVTPVEFSLKNKSRIYTLFKLLIERNLKDKPGVQIPYVQECDKQLSYLEFNKTSRGYLRVHHKNDSMRDDFPDALAGLCSLMINPQSGNLSVEIIGHESDGEEEDLASDHANEDMFQEENLGFIQTPMGGR
jgi:hypothetical protein